VTPPIPLGPPIALSTCPENTVVNTPTNEFVWNDRAGEPLVFQGRPWNDGDPRRDHGVLRKLARRGLYALVGRRHGGSDRCYLPGRLAYDPSDPNINPPLSSPDVYTTLDIGQTRDRSDFRIAEILFNEAGAVIIFPWKPSRSLSPSSPTISCPCSPNCRRIFRRVSPMTT